MFSDGIMNAAGRLVNKLDLTQMISLFLLCVLAFQGLAVHNNGVKTKEILDMEIGNRIKILRTEKHLTQQEFADALNVTVQTVSRWENGVNYPDIALLPELASFFHVSTDYLLGMKGEHNMARLLRTTEVFQVDTRAEAEKMVIDFKSKAFPKLTSHAIQEEDGHIILIAQKEFGVELDQMSFE